MVRTADSGRHCLIIAEAGENHCGDMGMARELVRLSAAAGCDYVKFQLYDARKTAPTDPERDWFFKVQLDFGKLGGLKAEADAAGVAFLCTPWDVDDARTLFDLGVTEIKIASFHVPQLDLLRFVNDRATRVFLSTGMSTLEEVDAAVAALPDVELYLLHCVSEYPLAAAHVNLAVMETLRERYGRPVGYSDHTIGILAPVAAAARGAAVVEKHITLDKALEGTDHILSADPADLKLMVEQIRAVQSMIGGGVKELTPKEAEVQDFLRGRFAHDRVST